MSSSPEPDLPVGPRVLLDANLLFVVVVSAADRLGDAGIKGCSEYEPIDAEYIKEYLGRFGEVCVTAHVLTEVSNLIGRCAKRQRRPLWLCLGAILDQLLSETDYAAQQAMADELYGRLGLTDAVIAQLAKGEMVVFTNDRDLHYDLERRELTSVHYDHMLRPHSQRS